MTAKQTPLYATHLLNGGKMVEYGGWELPIQYTGIKAEHLAVRTKAGLFDVSHMGEFVASGPDALAFLQKVVTNDVSKLKKHQVLYTPMCYEHGGTVDDLLVYNKGLEGYLLVVNAANIEKDWNWLVENSKGFHVKLINFSQQTAQLALQGPLSRHILSKLTSTPLSALERYWFHPEMIVAGKKIVVSRTGYTGEDGFELYSKDVDVVYLWNALMEVGAPMGLQPAGLGSRDTLRFEACFPLYGHELSVDISPVEAGLGMYVKLDKGDFIGRQALLDQKESGPKRKIVPFTMVDRGVARFGYPIWVEDRSIGAVTTGSYSPSLDKNLGLALLPADLAKVGQNLYIEIRGQKALAQVIARPFYKREGKY